MNTLRKNPVEYMENNGFTLEYIFLESKRKQDKTSQIGNSPATRSANEDGAFKMAHNIQDTVNDDIQDTVNDDFDRFLDQLKNGEEHEEEVATCHFCELSADEHKASFQDDAFSSNFNWLMVSKILFDLPKVPSS